MKTNITKTILVGSIIIGIVSCKNGNTNTTSVSGTDSTTVRQDVTTVQQDTADEWKYRQDEEAAIKANNQRIADMKTKVQTTEKEEVRTEYTTQLDTLEYQNTQMETRLHTYKRTDRNAWQDFKFHFNKDMDSLGAHISRIKI
jgi:TolA-binding protein